MQTDAAYHTARIADRHMAQSLALACFRNAFDAIPLGWPPQWRASPSAPVIAGPVAPKAARR
jgi:hypothetical protein